MQQVKRTNNRRDGTEYIETVPGAPMNDPLAKMKEDQGRPRRGRLKVYLGMAAGVGKTYGMLTEGQQELSRHTDVVIGYLEPHGRAETEVLAEGIEMIPPKMIDHRNVQLKEFDLDATLARNPCLVLVDELAHSNPEGSRHAKRWQDIDELLQAGINVLTTVNIQHIESLRDVVAQVTGVYVQETVPDSFFDQADEIELVDISPEQLHQRLKDGKVYQKQKIDQALDGFFRRSNLLALRELALRHTADRVDKDLRQTRSNMQNAESWHAAERILVCVAPNKMAMRVVRAARRLASSLHAEVFAVTVESSRQRTVSARSRAYQEEAMALAEKLGAQTANLAGDDIVAEVINFARRENVTTIVMGKPVRARWKEIVFGSVVDATIRASGDIDVLVITGSEAQGTPIFRRAPKARTRWQGYAEAVIVISFCTAIGFIIRDDLHLSNLVMLYLLGSVGTSMRNGIKESLLATILSIVAFDFFFVPPRFTFAVSDYRYVFTFIVMTVVSVILSALTTRLRESSKAVSMRERTTAMLYDLSRKLAESRKKEEMAQFSAQKASEILGFPTAIFVRDDSGLKLLVPSSSAFELSQNEQAVASWVVDHGQPAGRSTDTLSGSHGYYVPLNGSNGTLGVIGADLPVGETADLSQRLLIEAIANQLAGALERAQFAKDSHDAALQAETEQMRSDLLSAVSHDLRTPLASIEGSATTMLENADLSATSRELASTIQEESQRMGRLIRNLLDMTRVQGEIKLDLDWHSVQDLVANAIDRTEPLFDHEVSVESPTDQILIRVDGVLMEQVIVNLLENASRHAGRDSHTRVLISQQQKMVVVEVVDDGPGFASGDEQRVFDRFHRTGTNGFGLGLAICKAAVEAHGGVISARSLNPGAAFRIELPKEKEPE